MLKHTLRALALAALAVPTLASAASKEAAVELVNKAYEYWHTHGEAAAIKAFHDPDGEFIQGELYVYVATLDSVVLAHGGNPALAGRDLSGMRTPDGKLFSEEIINATEGSGRGWVTYTWAHPVTKKPGLKATYIRDLNPDRTFVAAGVYVEN